jgi:hypothetical protein
MDTDTQSTYKSVKEEEQPRVTAILEPVSEIVVVPSPWYKRIFGKGIKRENSWRLSIVLMLVVWLVVAWHVQQAQVYRTRAGTPRARITLLPKEAYASPDASVQLWVSADTTVTSAVFEIPFDNTHVQLVDISTPTSSPLSSYISTPTVTETNRIGIIHIALAIPSSISPPLGTFQLINLTLHSLSLKQSQTLLSVDLSGTELLHEKTPFTITDAQRSIIFENTKK